MPALRRGRLNGDSLLHGGGQHAFAVSVILRFEQIPARHAHHARRTPDAARAAPAPSRRARLRSRFRSESRPARRLRLRTGCKRRALHQVVWRRCDRDAEGSAARARRASARCAAIAKAHASAVSVASAGRITVRPGIARSRRAVRRLMRRPVLAYADAVVREDVERLQLAQRAEANRRLHVIREHQKRRAERKHAAMRRHAVHGRAHGMLADAEGDVASAVIPLAADRALRPGPPEFGGWKSPSAFERGVGGGVQIGRAADDVGDAFGERVQDLAAGRAVAMACRPASISEDRRPSLREVFRAIRRSNSAASFGKSLPL
jgi:hypothetical protein